MTRIATIILVLLAACSAPQDNRAPDAANPQNEEAPPNPPASGRTGLPSEGHGRSAEDAADPKSAEAAAAVLRDYFRLIGERKFVEAHRLWSTSSQDDDLSDGAFAASFDRYRTYRGEVGAPGRVEGAAGSLYVDIMVTVTGELTDGRPFRLAGPVTLRRVNDVPGAAAEQLQWRIVRSWLKPRPD